MTTVKHSKTLNLPLSPKRRYRFLNKTVRQYLPTVLFGSLLGTYLDLYFVGKEVYAFPIRPLSGVFSINVVFTLVGLPLFSFIFLFIVKKMSMSGKAVVIIALSLLGSILEMQSEKWGWFVHSSDWKHYYSIIGYFIYMILLLASFWITCLNIEKH